MSLLGSPESPKGQYCRKETSMDLLCSNFLKLYGCDRTETIRIDEAASRLALGDLFDHYKDAWKSWYAEATQNKEPQE